MSRYKTQKELFYAIWDERPHVSELSGKPLYNTNHPKWHWQFLHILSKGAYPSYKMNRENIILALPEEHERQEQYPEFVRRKEQLISRYYEEVYGKKF